MRRTQKPESGIAKPQLLSSDNRLHRARARKRLTQAPATRAKSRNRPADSTIAAEIFRSPPEQPPTPTDQAGSKSDNRSRFETRGMKRRHPLRDFDRREIFAVESRRQRSCTEQ